MHCGRQGDARSIARWQYGGRRSEWDACRRACEGGYRTIAIDIVCGPIRQWVLRVAVVGGPTDVHFVGRRN